MGVLSNQSKIYLSYSIFFLGLLLLEVLYNPCQSLFCQITFSLFLVSPLFLFPKYWKDNPRTYIHMLLFLRNKLLPTENLMDMRRWKRFCFFINGSPQGAIISPTCFIWKQSKTENHKNAWPTWHPGFLRVWLFHLVVSSSYLSTFSPSQQRLENHNDSRF